MNDQDGALLSVPRSPSESMLWVILMVLLAGWLMSVWRNSRKSEVTEIDEHTVWRKWPNDRPAK